MKTTVENIYKAFKALDSAKVSTLETAERQQVVKLWYALSDAGKKHSDLIEKTVKELRPEGFDALAQKTQFTHAELADFKRMQAEYEKAVEEVVTPEADKEVEVEIAQKISVATAEKMLAENNWEIARLREFAIVIDK